MAAFSHRLDQVTYPRMERQDLTQGQLGSFKFTPTDEVRSVFPGTSPRLAEKFMHSLDKDNRAFKPALRLSTTVASSEFAAHRSPDPATSPTRFNSTLFDVHFKPDLAKSRLRLGPTALRAAVDGSPTSPRKQLSDYNHLHPAFTESIMQSNMPTQNDDGSYYSSTQNTVPMTIEPATTTAMQHEVSFFHASLIRALATEQQAHQATKVSMEIERDKRIKAEAEAQKYLEQNRSLVGSVNMLKSVIQHSMKKEQEATEETETKCFHREAANTCQPRTILYDAVKHLKQAPMSVVPGQTVDNSRLFNLDFVDTHGSPALRKHFSTPGEEAAPKVIENFAKDTQLISISPEKNARREASDETWESGETVIGASCDERSIQDISPVLKVKSGNSGEPKRSITPKLMAMPFDAHVRWTQDPVFDDQQDKYQRIGSQSSIFAKHPVRYLPNKSNKNLYRTVMIDFIPQDATYKEVLENIRGGAIESIQLYGPIGRSTDFMTARIVFNYELGARGVYMRGQNPGIWLKGKRVRVWQVLEATYPRTKELEKEIFDDGFTRFLLIENAIEISLKQLPQKLAYQLQAGFIIEISKSYDGIPMIEFTSVTECSKALQKLMNDPDFGGSRFDFEEDPCNDPYLQIDRSTRA